MISLRPVITSSVEYPSEADASTAANLLSDQLGSADEASAFFAAHISPISPPYLPLISPGERLLRRRKPDRRLPHISPISPP